MGLRQLVKNVLPAPIRVSMRHALQRTLTALDFGLESLGRRSLKTLRSFKASPATQGLDFAMLCIRRPVYVDLALASVNSLHFHNPAHRVRLYLDSICAKAYDASRKKLDYPERVTPIVVEHAAETPWQFTKLDVVMDAFSSGIAFVDADSRWHTDPLCVLDREHVTFLVVVNAFRAVEPERILISEVLGRPEWLDLRHFNTGFISVPKKLFSKELAENCSSLSREIYRSAQQPRFTAAQSRMLQHTAEEISLSIGAQLVIGGDNIRTLKTRDGPGNREVLESYYYGAVGAVD